MRKSLQLRRRQYWVFALGLASLLAAVFLFLTSEVNEVRRGEHETIGDLDKAAQSFFVSIRSNQSEFLDGFMINVTWLGSAQALLALGFLFAGFLFWRSRFRDIAYLVTVGVVSSVSIFLLKNLYQRPRPEDVHWLIEVTGFSYPSGHAAGSASSFAATALILASMVSVPRGIGIAAIALVFYGLVALSRVYLGAHYFSDVIAGGLLGVSIALLFWGVFSWIPQGEADEHL